MMDKRIFSVMVLLIILSSSIGYMPSVMGDNWISGWSYRKYHVINPSVGAGVNYQVNFTVYYGNGVDSGSSVYLNGNSRTDFGDVRFTKVDGTTLLDYWIEKKVDGDYAIFWVEIADDLSTVARTIYLYYGNAGAASISNGANTFIFFEDFEDDLNGWTPSGQLDGPYSESQSQHKMVITSDGTIHLASSSAFVGETNSYIKHSISRNNGINWVTTNVKVFTPWQVDLPAIAKDSSDNLYMVYGWISSDGHIHFRKGTVDKTVPALWTWSWGADIVIDSSAGCGIPDIIVDSNNYIHVVYLRSLNDQSRWARSINGGTSWTVETLNIPQGFMATSIDIDSLNNLYVGAGHYYGYRDTKVYVEKISYLGGTSWSQGVPVAVSSIKAILPQLNVFPDDRISIIYGIKDSNTIAFSKTTNPNDISLWNAEVFIDETAGTNRDYTLAFEDSDNLKVAYLSAQWNAGLDVVIKESSDGGATWGSMIQITNLPTNKRAPASYREIIGGEMLLVYRDYVTWEVQFGNLWFLSGTTPYGIYGSSPTLSPLYAYTGYKSVKLSTNSFITLLQSPYTNKATHAHYYDKMSPLVECTIFSFDAGEIEDSWIGIINDINHYEYQLNDDNYDSSIDRTIGWHEFVTRCTTGLKQFIIDGNIMPVTGTENYAPSIIITNSLSAEVPVYWDTVFVTKFVYPEPSNGDWGGEDTGGTLTTTIISTESNNPSSITIWTVVLVIVDPLTTETTTSITVSVTASTSTCTTTSLTSVSPSVLTTTTTSTTSKETSKTTTTSCSSTTSKFTSTITTTTLPTTSVSTCKTTTSTATTSTLTTRYTTTSFSSTSIQTTRTTTTEFSTTSTFTSKTTSTTCTTTPTTTTSKCVTTTSDTTTCYTFTRSVATITYSSSTTSIRTDDRGIIYGEFTATGTSLISFTAIVYTATPTAWTWTDSISLFTTFTASQSANVPVFVSYLIDRFTLTSGTVTEIYDSYTYDAIVASTKTTPSKTITFGTTITTCSSSILTSSITSTDTVETCETICSTNDTTTETSTTVTSTCTTTTGEDIITVNVTTTTCTTLTNSLGSTSTSTITTISKITTTTTSAGAGGAIGGDTNILILPITIGAILTVLFVALGGKKRR